MSFDNLGRIIEKYKFYIISVIVLILLSSTFSQMASVNYTIQDIIPIKTITIDSVDRDAEFKINRIVDTYDPNGNMSYTVTFKISGIPEEITCDIPVNYEEELNKDAIYTGKIKLSYVREIYQYMVDNNEELETIDDAIDRTKTYATITGAEFMYDKYIKSEFKTEDEMKEYYEKLYNINTDSSEKAFKKRGSRGSFSDRRIQEQVRSDVSRDVEESNQNKKSSES